MEKIKSNGVAQTTKKTFSRETGVSIDIHADASILWVLLTNASDYPRWNSTVISIEGEIKKGEKIKLKSILDPKRVFQLSVKAYQPEKKLVWGDAMGQREYLLTSNANGTTNFSMIEKIGGPLFPLFSKMIPTFDASFEVFAKDLKTEAEQISKTK